MWRPCASTSEPQWHGTWMRGAQRQAQSRGDSNPDSLVVKPHAARCDRPRQKASRRYAVKMWPWRRQTETATSDWTWPPLCLLGLLGGPRMVVSAGGYLAEHRIVSTILTSRLEAWRGRSKHSQTGYPPRGRVCSPLMPKRQDTRLTSKPPSFTGKLAWSHCTSEKSAFVMLWMVDLRTESKTWSDWCDSDGEQRNRWRTLGALMALI